MAKRELSSTLKNLKFMQRGALKEDKAKREEEAEEEKEIIPNGNFPSRSGSQKCVIIMEGDPHPGATRGRMSFLNFNPKIDKLNGEQPEAPATSSVSESEAKPDRGDGSSQAEVENGDLESSGSGFSGDLKRKPAGVYEPQYPNKWQKSVQGDEGSSYRTPQKQPKREKLDWNLLKPPKSQSKRE